MERFSRKWTELSNTNNGKNGEIGNIRTPYGYANDLGNRFLSSRQSGGYYNDYLFTMQVRSAYENTDMITLSYLDLQANPIVPNESNSGISDDCFCCNSGVTYQLSEAGRDSETVNRFITAFCAGSLGGAFATWVEVDPNSPVIREGSPNLELKSYPVRFDENNAFIAPSQLDIKTLPLKNPSPGNNLRDMCCSVIGSKAAYFCVFWNDPVIYYFLFDGENVTDFKSITRFSTAHYFGEIKEIFSIDAITVYSNHFAEEGNKVEEGWSAQMVALTICYADGFDSPAMANGVINPRGLLELSDIESNANFTIVPAGSTAFIASNDSPFNWMHNGSNDPSPNRPIWPNVSIRTMWGSPGIEKDGSHPVKNGLIIYLEVQNTDRYRWWPSAVVATKTIDLEGYNMDYLDWEQCTGLPNSLVPGMNLALNIICEGDFIRNPNVPSAGFAAVYGTCFSGTGSQSYLYFSQIPSYRMTLLSDKTTDAIYNENWDESDFKAALSCWNIIGIIAGLPPIPKPDMEPGREGHNVTSTLQIKFASTKSSSSEIARKCTFGVEASSEALGYSGEYSYENKFSKSNTTKNEFSASYAYTNLLTASSENLKLPSPIPIAPENGLILFYQPNYSRQNFSLQTWDNQDTNISIFVLFVEGGTVFVYKFLLSDPNQPVNDSTVPEFLTKAIADFPDDVPTWPNTDDIEAWKELSASIYKNLVKDSAKNKRLLQSLGVNSTTGGDYINCFEKKESFQFESENSIKVGDEIDLEVFKLGASVGYSSQSILSYEGGDSFTLEFKYTVTSDPNDFKEFTVTPILYSADSDQLSWLPVPTKNQRPWLLTWKVS